MSVTADAELLFRPVTDLAGLVRRGELSARELVETSVRRIEELDGRLDAFIDVDGERALAQAEEVGTNDPRPFAGVPIAIKNNRAVTGWRLTHACDLMQGFVADFDHHVVRRFKEAGFIVVGTTNLPEYGILPSTEPRQKSSRNPWDPDRTPGGSSGGSAAAVAAGMVPIGHANDVVDMAIWGVVALIVQIIAYYAARIPLPDLSQRIAAGELVHKDTGRPIRQAEVDALLGDVRKLTEGGLGGPGGGG